MRAPAETTVVALGAYCDRLARARERATEGLMVPSRFGPIGRAPFASRPANSIHTYVYI